MLPLPPRSLSEEPALDLGRPKLPVTLPDVLSLGRIFERLECVNLIYFDEISLAGEPQER